jgi:HSP20 family protein
MSNLAFRSFDPLFADPFRMARVFFDAPARKTAPPEAATKPLAVRFDVTETEEAFLFEADLPGIAREALDITVDGHTLAVSGTRERKVEHDEANRHVTERSFGTFTRSFVLPDTADLSAIQADLDGGVLHVRVAKKAEVKPRKIPLGDAAKDDRTAVA